MSVPDYRNYSMKEHAKQRLLTRFNLTKDMQASWMTRLLSQATFLRKDKDYNNRSLYRFNDIVIVLDTKQKEIVTIWSQDRDDSHAIGTDVKVVPEVKEALNDAMDSLIDGKKRFLATKIESHAMNLAETASKMTNPKTNSRYIEKNWDILIEEYSFIRDEMDKAKIVIGEAQRLKNNK